MSTYATLLEEKPTSGVPVGLDDWTFSVQLAIPLASSSLYDTAIYGPDPDVGQYSDVEWNELTASLRGLEWTRGADEPGGRPRTGIAVLTLDNRDGRWTPWDFEEAAAYRRPGTLIRIAAWSEDAWLPQFAGIVESWEEESDAFGRERWATVTLMETVGWLASIEAQTVTAVGASEIAGDRFERLLDAADWPFGWFEEYVASTTMQATMMEANRLAELHLTADSIDGYFRSHRSGKAMVETAEPGDIPAYLTLTGIVYDAGSSIYDDPTSTYAASDTEDWTISRPASFYFSGVTLRPDYARFTDPDDAGQVDASFVYDGDSLVSANDADAIANDIRLTRVGGTMQVATAAVSVGRYGRHSLVRSGLLNTGDGSLATYADRILERRKDLVLRVVSVDLFCRPENLKAIMMLDLMDPVTVVLPDNNLVVDGHISSLEHAVSARTQSALLWTCRLGLTTYPGVRERSEIIETPPGSGLYEWLGYDIVAAEPGLWEWVDEDVDLDEDPPGSGLYWPEV